MPTVLSLPEPFTRRITEQLAPDEFAAFTATLQAGAPPVSVRLNRRKPSPAFPHVEPVPWCPERGRYLSERPIFALDPLWHAGAYYVQEPASMLLDWAIRTYAADVPLRRVLDMCAAPGGKTTLLADLLPDTALLVANEVIRTRTRILQENVTRWGWPNTVVTSHDPNDFAPLAGFFDLVVVDAPCSGEGLFRKDPEAAGEWTPENAALCAGRQQRILSAALPLVRPGGLLLYSTCTYNPAENDASIGFVLEQGGWELQKLSPPSEWGLTATQYGVQCWPHRCRGEGFFLALLRRTGTAEEEEADRIIQPRLSPLPAAQQRLAAAMLAQPDAFALCADRDNGAVAVPHAIEEEVLRVVATLPRIRFGLPLGVFKGSELIPSHELALSVVKAANLPVVELPPTEALQYLRKEPPPVPEDTRRGWTLMRSEGLTLGWAKVLPGRVNNYLPTEWRLRRGSAPA